MAADTSQSASSPFLKKLAANDKRTRDQAVESLRTYLSSGRKFESVELLKLWKGLFYCMWMSDRPLTQQRLATNLAGLVDVLRLETVVPWLDAFWKTMAREWNGIDVLRMNKFLFLIRAYLGASFRHLAARSWRDNEVSEYMDVLRQTPLNPTEMKIPNGLRYHVIDIYVDELEKAVEENVESVPLEALLAPLEELGRDSPTKEVRKRVEDTLSDDRVRQWRGEKVNEELSGANGEGQDGEDDEEWGGIED